MLKKLLAGIGIGAARVDFEIPRDRVKQGGTLEGIVKIYGGEVEQQIAGIYMNLVVTSRYKHDDTVRNVQQVIGRATVAQGMTVAVNSPVITIPVSLNLPWGIPVTRGKTRYYIETGLDIRSAVDPKDLDEIVVLPNDYMQMVLDGLRLLGFRHKPSSGAYNGHHQTFEYRPTSFMSHRLDELEVIITPGERETHIVMQIDKKARGLLGGLIDDLDLDERHVGFSLPYAGMSNADQVAQVLKNIIEEEYRKIGF